MYLTNRIISIPMSLQVCGVLMQFLSVHAANRIHHKMIMQVACINMGCDYHLEASEFPFCKLETNGIGLLWGQAIIV